MQVTAHSCIWTVTHRPLPPAAAAAAPASAPTPARRRHVHHDSGTDLTDNYNDNEHDQPTIPTPEWIHPPTSVYTLGTHKNPSLPASHHPNQSWLATSAALHSHSGADVLSSTTRSTLANLESLLLNHAARPLALHWSPATTSARGAPSSDMCVHVPLDTGVLARMTLKVNSWVPTTDLADIVLDATLADSASAQVKTVRDEYRNWTLATRRQVESVHESAAKRVLTATSAAKTSGGGVPNRWGAAVVAPHFIACHVPALAKVRVYFSVNRHKLVSVERRAMGTPTMVEVDVGKEVGGGGGAADSSGGGKVKLETLAEHLAVVGERSVAMYQIRETSGVMQINPTSTLAFGTDTLRVAHLSWGSTLLTLIQSSTPTVEGTTELWIRGYAFNTRSRAWEELDAHGPVISLPAVDTGDISAWTMGEPVLVGSSSPSSGNVESASAQAVNRPASTRSKAARAHAMSLMLGTSTGKLMHIAVQFALNSVSWNQVELSHPITPLAPSGVVHLAMHPGGCFISAVDTLGRVAIVDLVGKPVSVRHAFTSSPTSSSLADPIHPLQTLGFNAPPLLASWTPAPPHSPLTGTAPLPGQRVYVPTAVTTSTPSTLLLVFDRGPFAALTFDFASTSTSLIGYARHLLARGQIGWMHVMHLAKHLPLHSPRDIATLGHMLLNSIPTPAQGQHDPMFDSGAYHAQLARIATRVLEAYPAHASATSLARKLVHAHLAHGRLDSALSTAAGMAGVCSDLLHLIALCASQHANARGLAAAAHFQFLKTCPGPYPPLLVADPTPMPPDDGDGVPTVDELVDMYTRQVAPIAAGTKPAFGAHVRRLAAYLEVSGNREEALRWWRRVGYEEEGRRGADRVASVLGWWDSKRRGEGEGR